MEILHMTQVKCPNCDKFYISRQKKRFTCSHCGYKWKKESVPVEPPKTTNDELNVSEKAPDETNRFENIEKAIKGIKIEQKKILEEPRMGEDDKKDAEAEFECGACGAEWGREGDKAPQFCPYCGIELEG